MTARSPGAFMLSATFHAAIIGAVVLWAMMSDSSEKVAPRVLELVAGEGDNYGATVAPKLGTPGGVKLNFPAPPKPKVIPTPEPRPQPAPPVIEPEPEPVAAPPKATPVIPTPKPVAKAAPAPPKPVPKKTPTFGQKILYNAWAAEARAKKEIARQRAAEQKRLRDEAARKAAASARVPRIDGEGIAKGVIGGSAANKVGGAGGKALVAADGAVTERYFAMLKERVQNALDKPPGLSDELAVTVNVHIAANGRLSGARVVKSSGSDEFDRAVLAAFGRVSMPEHPEHKNEDLELIFKTRDVGDR